MLKLKIPEGKRQLISASLGRVNSHPLASVRLNGLFAGSANPA